MARYTLDEKYVEKYEEAIRKEEAVPLEVMETDSRCWLEVRAILSPTQTENSEPVTLYNFIKGAPTGREYYIRILGELSTDEEIPRAREPFAGIPKRP